MGQCFINCDNMKILIVLGIFCRLACSQSYVPSYGAPQPSYYQPRMYPVAVQPQYVPQYVNGGRSSYRSYEPYPQTYYARPTSTYQPVSHYQPRYSRDEPTPSYQPATHYQPVSHYQPILIIEVMSLHTTSLHLRTSLH